MGRPFEVPDALPLNEQAGQTYPQLVEMMRRLLAPDGCPWDRQQTFSSLKKYVLEEACEVIDAIEHGEMEHLQEELGDLALQVVFLSQLAQREGAFGHDDVFRSVLEKLVRRHPHVFEEVEAETPGDVEANWEAIKAREKRGRPLLDNIPRSLPALQGAARVSQRVASVGFDWSTSEDARAKVAEELDELDEAVQQQSHDLVEHELGDLLFAIVNYARHLQVDPERALRGTCDRFRNRFAHVEREVKERHGGWPMKENKPTRGIPLAELEDYWQKAKKLER